MLTVNYPNWITVFDHKFLEIYLNIENAFLLFKRVFLFYNHDS